MYGVTNKKESYLTEAAVMKNPPRVWKCALKSACEYACDRPWGDEGSHSKDKDSMTSHRGDSSEQHKNRNFCGCQAGDE